MKGIKIILLIVLFASSAYGQEWFGQSHAFEISGLQTEANFKNTDFYIVKIAAMNSFVLTFDPENKRLTLSYMTMGNSPILIVSKPGNQMMIALDGRNAGDYDNPKVISGNFRQGCYAVKNLKLVPAKRKIKADIKLWMQYDDIDRLQVNKSANAIK